MADEADMANDHIERELAQRIAFARKAKPVAKPKDCLNCGDPVREGCSFCGPDCLEDHEARERQRRISGAR